MKPKNRGGRPRKSRIKQGEKIQIGVRVSPRLQKLLERSAFRNGRSLTQESELRLEQSFDRARTLVEMLAAGYGPQLAAVLWVLGETMRTVATHATAQLLAPKGEMDKIFSAFLAGQRQPQLDHPFVFAGVARAVENVLRHLKPEGADQPPAGSSRAWPDPDVLTSKTIQEILSATSTVRIDDDLSVRIKEMLGSLRLGKSPPSSPGGEQ